LGTQLPVDFVKSLEKLHLFDSEKFIAVHDSDEQIVSVRFNSEKCHLTGAQWPKNITGPPFNLYEKVPWASDAFYLSARPSFTLDPLFHAGTYYVQEASGMFLEQALKQTVDLSRDLNVLDLCAAPGGKSTLIQSFISKDSMIVSNEVIKSRVSVLYQNMTKWGRYNGIITNNDPVHFKQLPGFFDVMLIDAPCSGSGLFRKDPQAAKHWSKDLVNLCCQRQRRILADSWRSLKENGILIYSTCSYSKEENEDMLDHICQSNQCISRRLTVQPEWNIVETTADQSGAFGYRFYPDKLKGEGLFLAVIQKKDSIEFQTELKPKRSAKKTDKFKDSQLSKWINPSSLAFAEVGDAVHAIPSSWTNQFDILKNTLYLKKAGIRLGKKTENDWIPDHELALGTILSDEVRCLELSKEEVLHFLRAEPFQTGNSEKGWHLVKYFDHGIGWVKLLGNRLNNYYPKSWRIRL
jgi:16S rRNA C967 or C1407 C5-methylase (RsmB/RsmF family)/NOL1/NOP2/fmu family ribosome biogenesis protein